MTVLVWITEDSWAACVDAVATLAPASRDVSLLHVTDAAARDAAHGAFTGLLGRTGADPGTQLAAMAEAAARELLGAAAARLGRPCQQLRRLGRPEHEVVTAAQGAALLVVAREGAAAGPKSLGKAARFVVDHAACPVLLIWPGPVPEGRRPAHPNRRTASAQRAILHARHAAGTHPAGPETARDGLSRSSRPGPG
jgi:nucleotide-binding universal stress UspA family protein